MDNNENNKGVNLQYNYAQVLESGECVGCITSTYEVNHFMYIEVSDADDIYVGKWYNRENGKWYYNNDFTEEVIELN